MNTRNKGIKWLKLKVSRYFPRGKSWIRKPVWWFEFTESYISEKGRYVNFLCQKEKNKNDFYHLRVPTNYLQRHRRQLYFRKDVKRYSLYLSAEPKRKFTEIRGTGYLDFAQFLL
ncbi:MAG TPA: hypothetical protein ENI31_03615 [Candidatus Omnitrophica bacterium]|nr:hypothetical protein [Candidatus Omnitrophota bacterium]